MMRTVEVRAHEIVWALKVVPRSLSAITPARQEQLWAQENALCGVRFIVNLELDDWWGINWLAICLKVSACKQPSSVV
jgi:hypothetical protein